MVKIFNAFIKPYTDYGNLAWGGAAETHLTRLKRSMNKAIKAMAFKGKYDSPEPYYEYFKILTMKNSIRMKQGKFMWNLSKNKLPDCIQSTYNAKQSTAINNTSTESKYILPYFRTKIGQSSLAYQGIQLWNNTVPVDIKSSSTYKQFSKKLKDFLMSI